MESSVRTLAKQLNVGMLVQACHRTVGIAEDILQDAILGVLAALLDREDEFSGRFPTFHHFAAYIRKAALRESIRVQKQMQREEPWQERSREETPESQFLAEEARYVASRQVSRLHLAVRQGLQELGKSQETIDHCETWAQWLRWFLPLAGAVAAVAIAMVLQPHPTKPGKQNSLRAKGTDLPKATLFVLRSRVGQGQQGTFLEKGDAVPQAESLSLGFRLDPPGGFVNIAWLHQGEPLAWLYQSKHRYPPEATHYLKRGKEIIKFPLSSESPGEVCLLLLQTKHKQPPTNQTPRALIKEPKRAPHPIPKENLVASSRFCLTIQAKAK